MQKEMEALQNAASSLNMNIIVQEYIHGDRRKGNKYYLSQNGLSISPILDYNNLNHFILGLGKMQELTSSDKLVIDNKKEITINVSVKIKTDKSIEDAAKAIRKGIYRELDLAHVADPKKVEVIVKK